MHLFEDFVDVGRVSLLSCLAALLLVARGGGGGLFAGFLLLCWSFASWGLSGGGWFLLCFWWHCVVVFVFVRVKKRDVNVSV